MIKTLSITLMLLFVIGCSSSDPKVPFYEAEAAYKEGNLDEAFKLFDETLLFINEMDPEDELYTTYNKYGMSKEKTERFGKDYSKSEDGSPRVGWDVTPQEFVNDFHPYLKEMSQYKTDLLPASVFFRRLGNGGPYEIGGEYEYSKNLRKLGDVDGWNKGFANETDEGFSLHRLTTAKKIADAYFKKGDYDKFFWILKTNDSYEFKISGKDYYEYATVLSKNKKQTALERLDNIKNDFDHLSDNWCKTIPSWGNNIINTKPSNLKYFRLDLDMLVFKYLAGDNQNSLDKMEALYKEKQKEKDAILKYVYLGEIAVAYSKCGQKEKSDEVFNRLEMMAPFTAEQVKTVTDYPGNRKKLEEKGMTDYNVPALESVYLHLTKMYAKAGYDKPLVRLQRIGINFWDSGWGITTGLFQVDDAIAIYPILIDLDQNKRMKKIKNKPEPLFAVYTLNLANARKTDREVAEDLMPTDFVLDLAEIYHSQGKNNLALELLNNFMTATVSDTNAVLGVKIGGLIQGESGLKSGRLFRFVDLYLALDNQLNAIQVTNQLLRKVEGSKGKSIRISSQQKNVKKALSNLSYKSPNLSELSFLMAYAKYNDYEKFKSMRDKGYAWNLSYKIPGNAFQTKLSYESRHMKNGNLFTTIDYLCKNQHYDDAESLLEFDAIGADLIIKIAGWIEIGKSYHNNNNYEQSKKYFDKAMLQAEFITPQPPSFLLAEIMVAYAKSGHIDELKKVYSAMPDYVYHLRDLRFWGEYYDMWAESKNEKRFEMNTRREGKFGLYKYEAILMSIPYLFKKDNVEKSWELFTEFSKMIHDMPDGPFFDEGDKYYNNNRLYYLGGWKPILISDLVIEWYNVFGNDENDKMMPFIEQTLQDMISKDPFPFYYSF